MVKEIGLLIVLCFCLTSCNSKIAHNIDTRLNIELAIENTRAIRDAQRQYQKSNGRYGSLNDLVAARLIDRNLEDGQDSEYIFELTAETEHYQLVAFPTKVMNNNGGGNSEAREELSLYVDETGVVKASVDPKKRAGPDSFPVAGE